MSSWVTVQAAPMEPFSVTADPDMGAPERPPLPEYWQLHVQKDASRTIDGVAILCEWRGKDGQGSELWEYPRITIAQQPVGTVLYTFADVGPLAGRVVVKIDRFGGLVAHLHYPTLTTPYQLDML